MWGFIPIILPFKSLGWPFHSSLAQEFYEYLSALINHHYQQLHTTVTLQVEQACLFEPEADVEEEIKHEARTDVRPEEAMYAAEDYDESEAGDAPLPAKVMQQVLSVTVPLEDSDEEFDSGDNVEDFLADDCVGQAAARMLQEQDSPTRALQLLKAAIPAPGLQQSLSAVQSAPSREALVSLPVSPRRFFLAAQPVSARDESHLASALQTILLPIQMAGTANALPLVELTKVKLNMLMRVQPVDGQVAFLQQILEQLQNDDEMRYLSILLRVLDASVSLADKKASAQEYLDHVAQVGHPVQLTLPIQHLAPQKNVRELWHSLA